MATVHHIDDERSASALAGLLNGNARLRPVAVVTIPAGRTGPWIDVEEIAREAGNLAAVYLIPTGSFTWEFSNRMAEGTQAELDVSIPSATSGRPTSRSLRSASPSTKKTDDVPRSNSSPTHFGWRQRQVSFSRSQLVNSARSTAR